jgi:hypothetical protein
VYGGVWVSATVGQKQSQTTMLVQAAEAGDFALVYALIAAGVDVNSANEHGTTALMAAAAHGHLAVVKFLLESEADFTAKRLDGFDALALAVFYGHLHVVRELLARGANPKTNERFGTSIDTWATIRGFHDIAHVLTAGETISPSVPHENERTTVPKVLEVEKQPSSVATAYVPKPRYNFKRKSRKLTTWFASIMSGSSPSAIESSYIKSTYVAKPRYRNKGKFQKLVRCLAYITSDSRRLTGLILILMLVCGLSVVAMLNLFGSSDLSRADTPVTISAASEPDNSSLNPQNDLQSSTQAQPIRTTSGISDASAEHSSLAEKGDDRSGPKVDNIEHSSRLLNVAPLLKSSERVDVLHPKAAMTSKQETQRGARSDQSASISPKSIPSTIVVASGVKASTSGFATRPPNTKTQRPRRVTRRNDQSVPAATAGRNTKAKVIQWP